MGNWIDDLASLYESMGNTPRSHTAKTPNAIYRRLDPAVLAPADPAILDLYGRALALLSAAGARIEPLALPCDLSDYQSRCGDVMAYDAYTCLKPTIYDCRRAVDPFVRRRVLAGRDISAAAHAQALALRVQDQNAFFAAFGPTDIPVLPTNPLPAQQVDSIDEAQLPMSRFTRLANYFDLCAVSVPVGTVSSAPAGMQFVANKEEDFAVLSLVHSFVSGGPRLDERSIGG